MTIVRRRALVALVLVLAQVLPGVALCQRATQKPRSDREAVRQATPVDLVIVPEREEWLLAAVAPTVARLGHLQSRMPFVLALEAPRGDSVRDVMSRFRARSCLVVVTTPDEYPDLRGDAPCEDGPAMSIQMFYAGPEPMSASRALAAEYWSTSESLVLADSRESGAAMIASTLAAHLGVPCIAVDVGENGALSGVVNAISERYGATRVLLVSDRDRDVRRESPALEVIDTEAAQRRVVEVLGPGHVSGVILARTPRPESVFGATSWAAPLLSLLRSAPVVLVSTEDALVAQEHVDDFVRATQLRPETVTILADYDSIGVIAVRDPSLGDYCVEVEPCSGGSSPSAAGYGVGRIQARSRSDATLMISRAAARKALLGGRSPSALMIANPESQFGQLPLCEAISRVTAEELKNWRVGVKEFYRMPKHAAGLEEAAIDADLIIFQGHVVDLPFFEDPSLFDLEESPEDRESYADENDDPWYGFADPSTLLALRHGDRLYGGHPYRSPLRDAFLVGELPEGVPLDDESVPGELPEDAFPDDAMPDEAFPDDVLPDDVLPDDVLPDGVLSDGVLSDDLFPDEGLLSDAFPDEGLPNDAFPQEGPLDDAFPADTLPDEGPLDDAFPADALPDEGPLNEGSLDEALLDATNLELSGEAFAPSKFIGPFDRLPLVILQSCHSLDEGLAEQALEARAVALLGTTTNVHSASGSAFVKVFCDSLLYRGASLGEALRDARNYFMCLGQLKSNRGHRELAKAYRVALSFRLWGDPELRLSLSPGGTPRRSAVAMELHGEDLVFIRTPDRQLPRVETPEYLARMFPGSVAAGIVKRLKHRPVRRILPLYFARIDLPEGVDFHGKAPMALAEHAERSSFLLDPLKRFLYALYLPEKLCRENYIEIPFVRAAGHE